MVVTPGEAELRQALEKLESMANAATPGPWSTDKPGRDAEGWARGVRICTAMGSAVYADPPGGQSPWADAQFIAAARTACVDLIAEARRLLDENDRLRAEMGEDITTRTGFSGQATEALK